MYIKNAWPWVTITLSPVFLKTKVLCVYDAFIIYQFLLPLPVCLTERCVDRLLCHTKQPPANEHHNALAISIVNMQEKLDFLLQKLWRVFNFKSGQ